MKKNISENISQIINHMTDDDLYKFTMACAVIDNFPRAIVEYTFIDRDNTVYPEGFADAVNRQIKLLENLVMTDEEIAFMKKKCYYIPNWFYTYMKGFRYDAKWAVATQDDDGHLHIKFNGTWANTILLEVKVLAIVSELYYIFTGASQLFDYNHYYNMSYKKAEKYLTNGCVISEFGTRRRSSFKTQDTAVWAFVYYSKTHNSTITGSFVGTSNVYLAMKYDLTPIGTMAHEFVCGIAGMYGGPTMANDMAMRKWQHTYDGDLGVYLYDSYGFDIFALNCSKSFANSFVGLRIDSGDNIEQLNKICDFYKSKNIDSRTKQVIFSNGLNVDNAIAINKIAKDVCKPSFGIGTSITNAWRNDCGETYNDIKPMNIVIKLTAIKITESWPYLNDTCKLSEDFGKHTGKDEVVQRFMAILPEFQK